MNHRLDNPVWNSLTTGHTRFVAGDDLAKRYPSEVAPFIAVENAGPQGEVQLSKLVDAGESLYLVGEHPRFHQGWEIEQEAMLTQMVWDKAVTGPVDDADILPLSLKDVPDMLELTSVAFPGFFRARTIEMGAYFGVRREGKLVAMAGERMHVGGYREVSGICTHPDHRGQGLAQRLISHVVDFQQKQGLIPFLHVVRENTRAREIYEKLGFVTRCELPMIRVKRL